MLSEYTIKKPEYDEYYENLMLSPLSPRLPLDRYSALGGHQNLETLYEKRSSFPQNRPSRFSATLSMTESIHSGDSGKQKLQDITVSSKARLNRGKVRYATRKALEANWEPDVRYFYGSSYYDAARAGPYHSSYIGTGRGAQTASHDDQYVPQKYLDDCNKLRNDGEETNDTGSCTVEKERSATRREVWHVNSHEPQWDSHHFPDMFHQVEHSYGPTPRIDQADASTTTRPPLQSKFSWSDSGSEDVEELPRTSKRCSFFGSKKREYNDSGYGTVTWSTAPTKSFVDSVRRSLGRR
jgi:hypothetical protein